MKTLLGKRERERGKHRDSGKEKLAVGSQYSITDLG